ncbi:hypothetical protein E0H82_15220 [Acinetobacter sp. ANC 4910]|uniref:HEPN domain-containing protein n=1 Tax=Acinetobacter sp. ANC 4910 TaxID=2529850 RepID=UPI001039769A|nr:HEPN domain-containing protein [Acinetobacter sp. ANC 4910]TCB32396.1 hypothetical protein E0H82_15220 [Acinetobacter sp. ANC 4910]
MLLLEEVFKNKKAEHSEAFNLRLHRGISWFKKSILLDEDLDLKFISLWISFNAIYAREGTVIQPQQGVKQFLTALSQLDYEHKVEYVLEHKGKQSIHLILDNPYIYQGFWDYHNHKISQASWKTEFEAEQRVVHQALQSRKTADILTFLFARLNTLRNQILQGGVSYNSVVNRRYVADGCNILSMLIPIFMFILLENAERLDTEKPFYPVMQVS